MDGQIINPQPLFKRFKVSSKSGSPQHRDRTEFFFAVAGATLVFYYRRLSNRLYELPLLSGSVLTCCRSA